MATAARRVRLVPDSVVVVAAVTGLLLGLAALCCCLGEHVVTHGTGRVAAVGLPVASDSLSDVPVVGDPPDVDADGSGGGCGHPGGHPVAVVASGGAVSRDLTAVAVSAVHRPDVVVAGPVVAVGGTAARAPASHLLCIMRT